MSKSNSINSNELHNTTLTTEVVNIDDPSTKKFTLIIGSKTYFDGEENKTIPQYEISYGEYDYATLYDNEYAYTTLDLLNKIYKLPHIRLSLYRSNVAIMLTNSYKHKFIHWLGEHAKVRLNKSDKRFVEYFEMFGRRFRILPGLDVIELGDNDFDRWANSVEAEFRVPRNSREFIQFVSKAKKRINQPKAS